MHNYSIDSEIRRKVIVYITLISVVLLIIVGIVLKGKGVEVIPLELDGSTIGKFISIMFTTVVTLTGILYMLFDKFMWKYFYKLHKIPNLNGIWEGNYISSYKNMTGSVEIKIKQTWSKIKIESTGEKSDSHSQIAGIICNGLNGIELRYEYYNKSNKNTVKTMNKHYGLNALTYHKERDELQGTYYTDKDRRTYGTIEVKRIR